MDDDALDEVYARLHGSGPEFDGWLSNHAPMAADALLRMGAADERTVQHWLDGYVRRLDESPSARWPIDPDDWREPWGDPSRLGDWTRFFHRQLAEAPWRQVLETWWPRLAPGSIASATHGLIRTGHAVRALRERTTPQRTAELAEALGYWAARWQSVPGDVAPAGGRTPGEALDELPSLVGEPGGIRTRVASLQARQDWSPALGTLRTVPTAEVPAALDDLVDAAVARYLRVAAGGSPLMLVHAATAPRAAALVLPALPAHLWSLTHAAAWTASATITALFAGHPSAPTPSSEATDGDVVTAAGESGDEHVVKFAETAREAAARGVPSARSAALLAARLIG